MIPEEEVLIAFKMVHSTCTLDPYEFVSRGLKGGIWYSGLQRIRTELLPAGQTKRFSTWAIIPVLLEVGISSKMAHNNHALDLCKFVSRRFKGGYSIPVYNEVKMKYCQLTD